MAILSGAAAPADLTTHWASVCGVALFVVAYLVVMGEERLHIRKSLPVIVAAGALWVMVALALGSAGRLSEVEVLFKHNLLDFAELFFFLLAAMTFVNTIEERGVFAALRNWLVGRKLSLRGIFWVAGLLAFLISPVADNLTSALVMGAICLAVGEGKPRFVSLSCISIVVAANAGGAFSPFGDITTLMVWQKGKVAFFEFFALFWPSLVNWLVPATLMSFGVERGLPEVGGETVVMKSGALTVVVLLAGTIALAVVLNNRLHLPPVLGMMTGLGVLNAYAYVLRRRLAQGGSGAFEELAPVESAIDDVLGPDEVFADSLVQDAETSVRQEDGEAKATAGPSRSQSAVVATGGLPSRTSRLQDRGRLRFEGLRKRHPEPFDVLRQMERTEWDTLMFFYGVIMCVGALGAVGYLARLSLDMYGGLGPTWANTMVGVASSVFDNIPIMFAVLSMDPQMSLGQWLLVTLTTGVGGSLLSIGSAAGVALMGQARGAYTFMSHLRWSWAVALGYIASVLVHLVLNRALL